ncbi:hypothetical protein D8674_019062 [Pyrus ussuriensis x Pyrus communis]|uniref:No apical meristem-associated C-terminal domain-containing protein n=1 Tax=Pyrus ussuriensis x Pyrus communis TaxID=2448454 RepID=A0A5N5GBX8_9ROSA|nr:hypothetical protein D8674_019062 [Pyrus ussuriensis x Pyrus communis]
MASSAMKGRAWTRKEDVALCKAYRWVLEDSVRGSSQTSEGVWTYPPQGLTPVFGTASTTIDMDEDGSPTIQQTREKGKANDDYANQLEVAASLQLMAKQNVIVAEEKNSRHDERAKQIQEEMDDKNMEKNTSNYTPMSKAYFDRKKKDIMTRRQLFTSDNTPTMTDDEEDVYRY